MYNTYIYILLHHNIICKVKTSPSPAGSCGSWPPGAAPRSPSTRGPHGSPREAAARRKARNHP